MTRVACISGNADFVYALYLPLFRVHIILSFENRFNIPCIMYRNFNCTNSCSYYLVSKYVLDNDFLSSTLVYYRFNFCSYSSIRSSFWTTVGWFFFISTLIYAPIKCQSICQMITWTVSLYVSNYQWKRNHNCYSNYQAN